MALKLHNQEIQNDIHASEMLDGDVAIITQWSVSVYRGRIVQRVGDRLITLGMGKDCSWPDAFRMPNFSENCLVRILPKGTTFILE